MWSLFGRYRFYLVIMLYMMTGCKKYPENILLVAAPEAVLEKLSGGHIVYCKVNGKDSTDLMRSIIPEYTTAKFNYSSSGFCNCAIWSSYYFNCKFTDIQGNTLNNGFYTIEFERSKKKITINKKFSARSRFIFIPTISTCDSIYNPSTMSVTSYHCKKVTFDILKLTTKELKITTIYKDKEYELLITK